MNKLVYVLALGVTGIAITVATTVNTDTTASFTGTGAATEAVSVDPTTVSLTNNVTKGAESTEAEVSIEDSSGTEIGNVSTNTTVTVEDSSVSEATATVTGTLTEKEAEEA